MTNFYFGLGFISGLVAGYFTILIPYLLYKKLPFISKYPRRVRICPYAAPEFYKPPYDKEYLDVKDIANHNASSEKQ